jgi:hypothetical protein
VGKNLEFYYFNDNMNIGDEADRLYKVRPVLEHLVNSFKISLDET